MLRAGKFDQSAVDRALETIERNAPSQAQLIKDILDVSCFITGRLRLDLRAVEPAAVIEAAVESVQDITPMLVEGYKRKRLAGNSRLGRPRLPVTVRGVIAVLASIFNQAIENELIGLNPCRKVRWGKGQTDCARERMLTQEEDRLLRELERHPEAKAATVIALNTGLRRMGILGLKVEDFDAERRTLSYAAKGGKVKSLPLNVEAFAVVSPLAADPAPGGYLFRLRADNNLSDKRGAFHFALDRARSRGLSLPRPPAHVLDVRPLTHRSL